LAGVKKGVRRIARLIRRIFQTLNITANDSDANENFSIEISTLPSGVKFHNRSSIYCNGQNIPRDPKARKMMLDDCDCEC